MATKPQEPTKETLLSLASKKNIFITGKMSPQKTEKANKSRSTTSQDIISDILGDFGIFQLRTVLIIFLCKIPAAWFMACIIFTAPELYPITEFQCTSNLTNQNQTISKDQCHVYEKVDDHFTNTRCTQFLYNFNFQSLIMQFDLVCFRDIFVAWTQYWHLFGVLVGGVVGTKMMIWLSPRTSYISGMITQIILGVATGYARDFSLHCIFRCLAAVSCAIMFTSGQAIFSDLIGGPYRWGVIMLYDTFWSIGVILLPGLSMFFKHWTYLYLGITFPTLLLVLLLQWTPNSPRWLLKNGTTADVEHVEIMLRKAAKINERSCQIPADFRLQLEVLREQLKKAPPPAAWRELWRGHYRAKMHMIATHIALAAYVVNFMGLLLNTRSFGREYRSISSIAMGLSEILGCFLALHIGLRHWHLKWQYAGILNMIGGAVACLGWAFTSSDALDSNALLTFWIIISMVPKVTVACAQSMMLACMAELVPSAKKSNFVFSAVTWARVWLLSAPFINVLKKIDNAMSLSVFGVIIFIGGVFTCVLQPAAESVAKNLVLKQTEPLLEKEKSTLNSAVWVFVKDYENANKTENNKV